MNESRRHQAYLFRDTWIMEQKINMPIKDHLMILVPPNLSFPTKITSIRKRCYSIEGLNILAPTLSQILEQLDIQINKQYKFEFVIHCHKSQTLSSSFCANYSQIQMVYHKNSQKYIMILCWNIHYLNEIKFGI